MSVPYSSKAVSAIMDYMTPNHLKLNVSKLARETGMPVSSIWCAYKKLVEQGRIEVSLRLADKKMIEVLEWSDDRTTMNHKFKRQQEAKAR